MSPKRFFFGWSLSIAQSLSSLALLSTSAWLISRASQQPAEVYLAVAIVGVRTFALAKSFFRYTEKLVLHDASFRAAGLARLEVFNRLVPVAPFWLSKTKTNSLTSAITNDVEEIQNQNLKFFPALIQLLFVSLGAIAIFLWLVPTSALIFAISVTVAIAMISLGASIPSVQIPKLLARSRQKLSIDIQQLVQRNQVIEAFGWLPMKIESIRSESQESEDFERRLARWVGLNSALSVLVTYCLVAVSVWIVSISHDLIPAEQIAVLVLVPLSLFDYLLPQYAAFSAKALAQEAQGRIRDLLPHVESFTQITGSKTLGRIQTISVKNALVRFSNGHLQKVPDIDINAGDVVALQGPSGAGKSTLGNLLVGFVKPDSGRISINDHDILEYYEDSLRGEIGLVEQRSQILAGSVRSNLGLAKPEATDSELWEVLEAVNLREVFENREGLETDLGSEGSLISGGEASRVTFARYLLARRSLVILDEPGANLPFVQSRNLVCDFINQSKKHGFSLVIITHNEKIAKLAERVVNVSSH